MEKKRILIIIGTRPEAIKMAPVIKKFKENNKFNCYVLATGQHQKICDDVLLSFGIEPDFRLNVMTPGQTLASLTCKLIDGITEILEKNNFDIVLVHGDTTTAYCGAVASFYNHIPVGHVEAGLRSFDFEAPFPEEFNRVSIDSFASFHFAPTEMAKNNLLNENINEKNIVITGNTAIDALMLSISDEYSDEVIEWVGSSKLILLTAHRRENQGNGFKNIFYAVDFLTKKYNDIKVVYPMHPNPLIRELAKEIFKDNKKVLLIEPQVVESFHNLMNHSYIILTDSGGIQEEAPSLKKPVLVLRDVTERPEGIEAGTLKLVGTDKNTIINEASKLLDNDAEYSKMANSINPYGDGKASERIVNYLVKYYE